MDIKEFGEIVSLLVGYCRKIDNNDSIKLSINRKVFKNCESYLTSDGQEYVPLTISIKALQKVMDGERSVTTVSQLMADIQMHGLSKGDINDDIY